MNFTFGIITDGHNPSRLNDIIDSIELTMNSDYEIIIIGGSHIERKNTRVIPFDEDAKNSKISIKKNIITDNANFENIVYLHDYIKFDQEWHKNFLKFGNSFNICINPILNTDGTRYRDWCLWKDDANGYVEENNYLIPYNITHLSGMMYISGAYWIAKKDFMKHNRLNEKLSWGQGEDVEWSLRVRELTDFKMNVDSKVIMIKNKDRIFKETTDLENESLIKLKEYRNPNAYEDLIKKHLSKWMN